MKTIVLFHDDSDGFASALSVKQKYPDAEYRRVQYGQKFPEIELDKNTDIIIVDFSYAREILDDVYSRVNSLLVIDHHDTAKEQLEGAPYAIFDMTKSGAKLCWEYFNPGKEVPGLINLVEDRDMWRFNLKDSKTFEAGVNASGFQKDLEFWGELLQNKVLFNQTLMNGRILVQQEESFISNFIKDKKYRIVNYGGYKVAFYNAISYISELGSAINNDSEINVDFTMSYFITKKGEVVISFRGSNKNNIEVNKLAKELGQGQGGGHQKAAGCVLPLERGLQFLNILYSQEYDERKNSNTNK